MKTEGNQNAHSPLKFNELYDIGKTIGQGKFGEVRICYEKISKIPRAVKTITKSLLVADCKQVVLQEIEFIKKLDHPNIIKIYGIYDECNMLYIVQEYCEGGDLFSWVEKYKQLSENVAKQIIKQLTYALSYCHANKIVHRDIKPENILMYYSDPNNISVKLIDFDTSVEYNSNKRLKELFGSLYYIAPEVLYGNYDQKCDVWSLGVVTYILLSGFPPFYGTSDKEVCSKVQSGEYNFNKSVWKPVSENAKQFIKACLTYAPSNRPSAVELLQLPWFTDDNMCKAELSNSKTYLQNMISFKKGLKIQKAISAYIIKTLKENTDFAGLKALFMTIDKNNDGKLSKEELIAAYKSFYGSSYNIEEIVNGYLSSTDINNHGYINYTEFLTSAMNKDKALSEENLKKAFSYFDSDKSGKISIDELKKCISLGCGEGVYQQLFKEIDINNDGELSYFEFQKMMKSAL